MRIDEFKTALATDLSFATALVIANNPEAVKANLTAAGYPVTDPEDMIAELVEIHANGDIDTFVAMLSVPVLTDQVSQAEAIAIRDVAMGFQAQQPLKSFDIPGSDITSDGGAVPDGWDSDGSSEGGGGGFWANFGTIIGGLATLGGALIGGGQQQQQVPSAAAIEAERLRQQGARERMTWTIVLVLVVLAALAGAWYLMRGKKAGK